MRKLSVCLLIMFAITVWTGVTLHVSSANSSVNWSALDDKMTASGPITTGGCGTACKWAGGWICIPPADPAFMCVIQGGSCSRETCQIPCDAPCS